LADHSLSKTSFCIHLSMLFINVPRLSISHQHSINEDSNSEDAGLD
jgi:hypothetical protein